MEDREPGGALLVYEGSECGGKGRHGQPHHACRCSTSRDKCDFGIAASRAVILEKADEFKGWDLSALRHSPEESTSVQINLCSAARAL